MRRAGERTTLARVMAGALFSLLAPALALGTVYGLLDPSTARGGPDALLSAILISPVFGLLLGWPYLTAGLAAWAVLDHVDRHHPWAAALVGLAVGTSVAVFSFRNGRFFEIPGAYPLCIGVGLLTGLGVWWIAYGRQGRLKPLSELPRSRLVL